MTTTEDFSATFDLFDPQHTPRRDEVLQHSRESHSIISTTADDGYHIVTRYDDVRHVCEHPEMFSSAQPGLRGVPIPMPPLSEDPPNHAEFRRMLNRYLSRSFLLRYEEEMRRVARELLVDIVAAGRCEFMHEFAIPFTSNNLARVILDEKDEDRLAAAIDVATRIGNEGRPELYLELAALAGTFLDERIASNSSRDDVLTALVNGKVQGRPLSREEMLGAVTVLFSGGLDTTKASLGNIAAHLAQDAGIEGRLRDPAWIRSDMDEFLRFETPVTFMARTVTTDTEVGGCPMKAGDRLALHFASANRDQDKFQHPDELDFDRKGNPHAAFGLGIHRCIGLNFARLQIEIAFEELLRQVTNVRITDGAQVEMAHGIVYTPELLPISFDHV